MEPTPAQKKAIVLAQAAGPDGARWPEGLVSEHCRRLDSDYFNEFSVAEIEGHLDRIAGLTRAQPCAFHFSPLSDRTFGFTVVGEDLPGFFALLSGVIASHDLDIKVGKVFTYAREVPEAGRAWPEERL